VCESNKTASTVECDTSEASGLPRIDRLVFVFCSDPGS
jgi:hypothetical protein